LGQLEFCHPSVRLKVERTGGIIARRQRWAIRDVLSVLHHVGQDENNRSRVDEVADPAEIASDRDGGCQKIAVYAARLGDSFDLVALETVKLMLELSYRRRQRTRSQEGRERLDRIG
jgi:hypothetical protein